ncbi:MAG: HD-GYP domain-containing protein [Pseudomonadota bacterium]
MAKKKGGYKKLHLVKIPTSQLAMGMHVAQLDRPWLDTPFLLQGFPLEKQSDLDALRNICEFVYIDVLKTHYLNPDLRENPIAPGTPVTRYETTTTVEEEIRQASPLYHESLESIQTLLKSAAADRPLFTKNVKRHIKACVDSIERNPSAMVWLTRIKHVDQYTAEHCVNVGMLAIALGRHLGVNRQQLEMLGLCGILHDVGKMKVNQDLLNKQGRLTADEFEHIKLHTTFGRDILLEDSMLPAEVIAAAYSHHERQDGRGYPEGIGKNLLGFYTRAVSIVDAYDAITSRRCYSAPRASAQALKVLYENSGTQFDQKLVVKFIECIGIYPPGSLVEMDTGEVGVVLSVDAENRLLPKVSLLLDPEKRPMSQQRVIDLQLERATGTGPQHRVKTVLVDGSFDIDLEAFTKRNVNTGQTGEITSQPD